MTRMKGNGAMKHQSSEYVYNWQYTLFSFWISIQLAIDSENIRPVKVMHKYTRNKIPIFFFDFHRSCSLVPLISLSGVPEIGWTFWTNVCTSDRNENPSRIPARPEAHCAPPRHNKTIVHYALLHH